MEKMPAAKNVKPELPTCGIVMPISGDEECSADHWLDVRHIIEESIERAEFVPQMVSAADDVGIIQKRIIQNIYGNPIVVCDVGGKNPNVMFELGMRLAFDKPTIIVKDDKTEYTFDTSIIEHLEYPRDLRHPLIVDYQKQLVEKIQGTHKKATTDANYTTFLKNFGTFSIPVLNTQEVSKETYMLEQIQEIKQLLLDKKVQPPLDKATRFVKSLCLHGSKEQIGEILTTLQKTSYLSDVIVRTVGKDHYHIPVEGLSEEEISQALKCAIAVNKNARLLNG